MIDEQLSKLLDSYIARVPNSDDKILLVEAIEAARVSALRAAHFALWLSCIESFKRKFRELAGRDSGAGRILGEIARLDEERRYIDSYVLEQAKAFGLISAVELAKLVHIQTMDFIYRCPYEREPTFEEFIADASVVVDSVLCRSARLQASSYSKKVHFLAQEMQSVSCALEKYLKEQKQSTLSQKSVSQKSTVSGKFNSIGQAATPPQLVSQTPLQSESARTSNQPEVCPARKPKPQATPPVVDTEAVEQ